MATFEIIQGDLSDLIKVGLSDNSSMDSNYACTMKVQGTAITRTITDKTDDNVYFIVQIEPDESATLRPGPYKLAVRITNDTLTPEFSRETQIDMDVREKVI